MQTLVSCGAHMLFLLRMLVRMKRLQASAMSRLKNNRKRIGPDGLLLAAMQHTQSEDTHGPLPNECWQGNAQSPPRPENRAFVMREVKEACGKPSTGSASAHS